MMRPTDQIVVIEKIVCYSSQEEGACHVIRSHERKPLDQGGRNLGRAFIVISMERNR